MTKEEILAMEPGPELDALVAERVMGHPMPDFIPEDALDLYLAGAPIHYDSWTCVCRYDEGDIPKWVPDPYSTDISAAWPVIEKVMEQKHCHCKIDVYPDGLGNVKFTKATGPFTPDEILAWAGVNNDMTVPEAICKAALIVFVGK